MPGKNNNSSLSFVGLVIVVVGVSGALGYYLAGSGHTPATPPGPAVQSAASSPDTAQAKPTDRNTIIAQGGDYTAPGAPKIQIREIKPPRLTDTSHLAKPPAAAPDPEASQVGAQNTTDNSSDTAAETSSAVNVTSPVTGDTTTSGTASSDPDYESVGSTPATATPTPPDDGTAAPDSTTPYRVQVGAFAYAKNAKVLADALKNRGYSATTVSEQIGDKTVYHVQTGAFRSQKTADKSSQDLQKDGFPAFTKQAQPDQTTPATQPTQ